MPALRASVLIIGHPEPASIAFGADFAATLDEARTSLREFHYPVIAVPSFVDGSQATLDFLEHASAVSPLTQRVIMQNETPAEFLRKMINTGSVFRVLTSYADPRFDLTIQEALEEYRLLQQNMKLLQLVNEQNDRLKKLTGELEIRVEARRKSLDEAKEKLLVTNHRVEALHRALVAIHRAGSIAEMERLINEALSGALGLSWTRILFNSQSSGMFGKESIVTVHSAPLMRGKDTLGLIYFARSVDLPFSRDEISFLGQIADSVALAIDRLTKLEQSETLKHQWEATFDAILDPVSLMTSDYTLVRINRSFADRSGAEPERVIGRKCFEALFGRSAPCENCSLAARTSRAPGAGLASAASAAPLGTVAPVPPVTVTATISMTSESANFRLKPARTSGATGIDTNAIFDVFSQEIQFKPDGRAFFVNMYHDVSAQLRFERQILESAKMAELGTIGSSIAHELNNPLGGMLSFLQLIKMDLKGHEPWFSDIDEMETGARRCRDIVQSLLGFTRKTAPDTIENIDLREVIEQALKITELQTRSVGISITQALPEQPVGMRGQFNLIVQALRNFLQNAQEAIGERLRSNREETRQPGEIKITLSSTEEWNVVEITDNGAGFDPRIGDLIYEPMYTTKGSVNNPGLGLTVAQQIIRDHGGAVEISSTKGSGTWAKISLPVLVP